MPKKKVAKKLAPHIIGSNNEDRCIRFILENYHIYGVIPTKTYHNSKGKLVVQSDYIERAINVKRYGDLFSVEYQVEQWDKKLQKNVWVTKLAGWDIVAIPHCDEIKTANGIIKTHTHLIQSKTNFRIISNVQYITALHKLKLPSHYKKQILNWVGDSPVPEIINL